MLIYVVTDRTLRPDLTPEALVDEAAGSGADMIQIREKDLPARAILGLVRRAVGFPIDVFVNARCDVAQAAGAMGVHLPADGLPPAGVAAVWGGELRIGVSTHRPEEAEAAQEAGADFVVYGPVYETPSKKAYGRPLGVEGLRAGVRAVDIPVLAIGGIDRSRVAEVAATGAWGVAVISSVIGSRNMRAAVAGLRGEET